VPAHLPALDGLRAVAISLVLWQHAGILFGGYGLDMGSPFWRASRAGWWGVDLFFVLSGFLITRVLLRQPGGRGSLGAFWRRRAARTLPLLYVYLTVTAAYGMGGAFPVQDQPWLLYLTHTANWHIAWHDFGLPIFGMLWSLGVEEQFYVLWPLVVKVARRRLLGACAAAIVAAPLARLLVYRVSDSYAAFHVLPFCRVDTLAMGAALAVALSDERRAPTVLRIARFAAPPAAAVLSVVTVLALGPWPMARWEEAWVVLGYSAVGLSCTALVAFAAEGGLVTRALLGNPVLGHVGRVSYGVYLWHCLVAHALLSVPWDVDVGARIAVWLAIVTGLATASWFGIERPWVAPRALAA